MEKKLLIGLLIALVVIVIGIVVLDSIMNSTKTSDTKIKPPDRIKSMDNISVEEYNNLSKIEQMRVDRFKKHKDVINQQ